MLNVVLFCFLFQSNSSSVSLALLSSKELKCNLKEKNIIENACANQRLDNKSYLSIFLKYT